MTILLPRCVEFVGLLAAWSWPGNRRRIRLGALCALWFWVGNLTIHPDIDDEDRSSTKRDWKEWTGESTDSTHHVQHTLEPSPEKREDEEHDLHDQMRVDILSERGRKATALTKKAINTNGPDSGN